MSDFVINFRIISTIFPEKELVVTMYRSPGSHPSRFENLNKLQRLKATGLDKNGYGVLRLSETEIKEMISGRRKTVYLVLSVDHKKQPIFITGAQLLSKLAKAGLFAIDLKNDTIISNYDPEKEPIEPRPRPKPEDNSKPPPRERKFQSLGEQAEENLRLRRKLNEDLTKTNQADLLKNIRRRKKRRQFIRNLILKGLKNRRPGAGGKFVPPDENPQEAHNKNMQEGMRRLGQLAWRGMALYLTKEFLQENGISIPRDWRKLTPKDWAKIKEQISDAMANRRHNRVIEDCRKKHLADDVQDELRRKDGTNDDTESTDVVRIEASSNETSGLEDIFNQLCADLESRLDTSLQPNSDDIAQSVQQSISAGPADTTAYYDFHTLTIAWEDTWSSVYDDYTEREVAKVYDDIVEVVGDEVATELENTEYEELMEFLDDLNTTVSDSENSPGRKAPPDLVAWIPEIDKAWSYLSADNQTYLKFLKEVSGLSPRSLSGFFGPMLQLKMKYPDWMIDSLPEFESSGFGGIFGPNNQEEEQITPSAWARDTAQGILDAVDYPPADAPKQLGMGRLGRLLDGIHTRLYKEPYEFDVFAPGSYNFGLVHTYQQRWKPLNYQVGDLISTMPLAPGEKKTYSVKRTDTSKSSSTSKRTSSLMSYSESTSMARSQADIVAKAAYSAATSATVNTNFGMKIGMFNGSANTSGTMSGNASSESQTTKQNIRESTLKATQEYKDERSVEVTTSQEASNEYTMTSEISNPNNEITVTYLFYELQRRFEVSSRLDKLTPVVLVAFDVPQPSEIDEDWLLTHDWILRRAMLDPSLAIALDYIRKGLTADELSVEVYKAQWEVQLAVVEELKNNLRIHENLRKAARGAMQGAINTVADKFDLGDAAQAAGGLALPALGSGLGPLGFLTSVVAGGAVISDALSSDLTKEEVAALQETARLGLEWANADMQDAASKVQSAVYALEKATQDYVGAVMRRQQMRTRIDQLRIHVKENILYYMQAIWAHEPPDQRYFRLYDQEVIWPEADGLPQMRPVTHTATPTTLSNISALSEYFGGRDFNAFELKFPSPKIVSEYDKRPLHQIADLDDLLGFKGNYAIFPLKDHNAVTNFMSQGFLDNYFGLTDPDPYGDLPTESEALEIAKCLWERAGDSRDKRAEVVDWLTHVLKNQIYVSDEIVVPSGEMFIEALPGSHPLLEDFKLRHRAVDMEKARQGLTNSRIESIRRIKRLMDEDMSDPDVDKNIHISGSTDGVIVDTE